MEVKDILAIIIIPLVLSLLGILWPEIQRRWRGRTMENLILRELSEIAPHPPDSANRAGWWEHQQKQFIHRKVFLDPHQNIDFLLSLDANMVYFVNELWQSLDHKDWDQWEYALKEITNRYDTRLERFGRRGKLQTALCKWQNLHAVYLALAQVNTPLQNSISTVSEFLPEVNHEN